MNNNIKEIIEKLNKYKQKQEIWYDKDNQQVLELLCSELRIATAEIWLKVSNWKAWREQQKHIYINKYKNNTDMKSDAKCKAKFESDNEEEILRFRKLRWEYFYLLEVLKAYQNNAQTFKDRHIAYMHENKLLNNK